MRKSFLLLYFSSIRVLIQAGTCLEAAFADDLTLLTSPSRGYDGAAIYRQALAEIGQPAP